MLSFADYKDKISKSVHYHIENNIPFAENIYRIHSEEFYNLFREARELYKEGLLSELTDWDKQLLESDIGGVMIPDYDNAEVSGYGWRGSSEYTGNKSSYLIPMFSFEDKFIGVLGVDYVFKKKRLTKEEWDTLKKHSYKISGYLSNYLEK